MDQFSVNNRKNNIILIVCIVLFVALFIFQMSFHEVISGWRGIIAQLQVLISVFMVVRVPVRGARTAGILNGFICFMTAMQVIRYNNLAALPGVFVPLVTITIVEIISYYNRQLVKKTEEINAEKNKRINDIVEMQDVSIMAMSAIAETRDNETGKHVQRTKLYVKVIIEWLYDNKVFEELTQQMVDMTIASAPLHDIGKVGIPDAILKKPAKLTTEEFEVIKTHTTLGYEALQKSEELMGATESFLKYAGQIILYHHEKWDGSGYVHGLKGDEIPLPARIMAVADVYDALTDKRCYKERFSHTKALSIISDDSGTHFDPRIVKALFECQDTFAEIAETYREHNEGE